MVVVYGQFNWCRDPLATAGRPTSDNEPDQEEGHEIVDLLAPGGDRSAFSRQLAAGSAPGPALAAGAPRLRACRRPPRPWRPLPRDARGRGCIPGSRNRRGPPRAAGEGGGPGVATTVDSADAHAHSPGRFPCALEPMKNPTPAGLRRSARPRPGRDQAGPVSMGASGSLTHSDSEPSYTATLSWPSKARTKASALAAMPPPQ